MGVSLVVIQSMLMTVVFAVSSGWAMQQLLHSQRIIENNDDDLELQPLETAGTLGPHRTLSIYQALRMAYEKTTTAQ